MKRLLSVLCVVVLWRLPASWAQLNPPNEVGVSMGQIHTIVRDMDAAKKFWILLGGRPIKIDGTEVMKFPGVFVFLTRGEPTGGSNGTPVDHVGFWVRDGVDLVDHMRAMRQKTSSGAGLASSKRGSIGVGYVYSPDDLGVEVEEGKNTGMVHSPSEVQRVAALLQASPAAFDHVHFSSPAPQEARAWYVKMFGASSPYPTPYITSRDHKFRANSEFPNGRNVPDYFANIAGTRLNLEAAPFPPATGPVLPTKGRALDYIGFEVKNLESFCKKLESQGIKFEHPYSKSRHKSFASADLTDPWGASIELTEGLNRF